jgi:D-sedoheptulose 7-phosphate isomerase
MNKSDVSEYLAQEIAEHAEILRRTADAVREPFQQLVAACTSSIDQGHKIVFFGNGGSAADAQHFATELVVRYQANRRPIRALALTTDTSAVTAIGNDLGFDCVFARQIDAVCDAGDVAIGISTSGTSENVIRGLRAAREKGVVTAAFTGGSGGQLPSIVDHAIIVPSCTTARIQEMHLLLGHTLCGWLERRCVALTQNHD